MENHSRPATGYPASGYPTNAYTTGTAYPYTAPPPPQPNPYYAQPYPDPRTTLLRRLTTIIAVTFIVFLAAVFLIWIIIRPRAPEFRLNSMALSNFNLSSSSSLITGNWDVRFTVSNPNHKLSLSYDRIDASVFYKDESLAENTLPPFAQGRANQTAVRATFAAAASYVDKPSIDGMNWDRTNRGSVNFNVRMVARVRLKAGSWPARWRLLRVYCGDLAVGLSSNSVGGSLVGGARQCRASL